MFATEHLVIHLRTHQDLITPLLAKEFEKHEIEAHLARKFLHLYENCLLQLINQNRNGPPQEKEKSIGSSLIVHQRSHMGEAFDQFEPDQITLNEESLRSHSELLVGVTY